MSRRPSAPPSELQCQSALKFLAGRIDYERTLSMPNSEEAFKLDRMRNLLRRLGDPQSDMPVIHIAGTKGKGSTAAMIAAILTAAGYRTGLFTSPHLDRVEERMVVDGQICSAEELAGLIEEVRPAVEALDRSASAHTPPELGPTYFEIITAAALCHFRNRRVQAAVLEVGLGGRLDSTNVCSPVVTVITSISLDHTKQLGDTLAKIAAEKAGIIKPGVPVLSGVTAEEPREVIRAIARRCGSPLMEQGVDFTFDYHPPKHLEACFPSCDCGVTNSNEGPVGRTSVRLLKSTPAAWSELKSALPIGSSNLNHSHSEASDGVARFDFQRLSEKERSGSSGEELLRDVELGLLGRHQAANAALAVAAVDILRRKGWSIPEAAVRRGLAEVRWPARVEIVARRPAVVLDAAHNAASIRALTEVLSESFSVRRRLLIFATTREKDLRGMLSPLLQSFDHIVFTRYLENPRAVPPDELLAMAEEMLTETGSDRAGQGRGRPQMQIAATPADAWNRMRCLAETEDLVCVTGSFFIAAEIRRCG